MKTKIKKIEHIGELAGLFGEAIALLERIEQGGFVSGEVTNIQVREFLDKVEKEDDAPKS